MGGETGSRSKFNSIPFYELFLKSTTSSINDVFLMSQFQASIKSRDNPPNIQTLILVCWFHYADARVDKWLGGKYTLNKQGTKNSFVYNKCCIFEDENIFVNKFNTSSYSLGMWRQVFLGAGGRGPGGWDRGRCVGPCWFPIFGT